MGGDACRRLSPTRSPTPRGRRTAEGVASPSWRWGAKSTAPCLARQWSHASRHQARWIQVPFAQTQWIPAGSSLTTVAWTPLGHLLLVATWDEVPIDRSGHLGVGSVASHTREGWRSSERSFGRSGVELTGLSRVWSMMWMGTNICGDGVDQHGPDPRWQMLPGASDPPKSALDMGWI